MQAKKLVQRYLPQIKIMQLATAANNQPYICTVHYYSDNDLNLYWYSSITRRHSKEVEENSRVTAYVLVHENTPEEDYVTGITIIGTAVLIGSEISPEVVSAYARKLDDGPDYINDVVNDKSTHKFYQLKPEKIVLFDNKNFPDDPRQEFNV